MKIPNFKIQQFITDVANENIFGCLLYGPEESVANYRFNVIAKRIVADLADPFSVVSISKERLKENKSVLFDEFYSISMFGGRRLISIKDSDNSIAESLDEISKNLSNSAKENNFILIQASELTPASSLRKFAENNSHFASIACYEDDEKTIKTFIEAILKKSQIAFDSDVIMSLMNKFGKNRQIILSEIEKIVTFLGSDKRLTLDIVDKLIKVESEISADEFVIYYASQNYEKALKTCERLFQDNFEPVVLTRFLINYFQKLYDAKVAIVKNDVDFDVAIKDQRLFFKAEVPFRAHLNSLSLEFISGSLVKFSRLELNIKQGNLPAKLEFISFVSNNMPSKINL